MDGGRERLILGFDGGCMACADAARRIEEKVGGRLEVLSLHDPQTEQRREETLGEDAPWAPTLVEVGGAGDIRAWAGAGMAVRLGRALGLVSTWRVMQAIGGRDIPKVASVETVSTGGGMSRGRFLKGMGGAALGFGFLFGSASPARAVEDELDHNGLIEVFTAIEQIPNSVIRRGSEAVKVWLARRLQTRMQPGVSQGRAFSYSGCAWAVGKFVALNAIPIAKILKIRKAIKAVKGVRNFVAIFQFAYKFARKKKRYGKWKSVRFAARHVAEVSRVDVTNAILGLFEIPAVWNNCTW